MAPLICRKGGTGRLVLGLGPGPRAQIWSQNFSRTVHCSLANRVLQLGHQCTLWINTVLSNWFCETCLKKPSPNIVYTEYIDVNIDNWITLLATGTVLLSDRGGGMELGSFIQTLSWVATLALVLLFTYVLFIYRLNQHSTYTTNNDGLMGIDWIHCCKISVKKRYVEKASK